MRFSLILSMYFSRVFAFAVLGMLAALAAVVGLFDFIELLRRSATKPDATFTIVSEIAALRLPWVAMQILPFGVLLGGMIAFWRLTRSSELVVARAAGVSAWQFLAAPTLCAVLLGAIATGGVGPISALMRGRAEQLENLYLKTGGGPLALNGGSFWLRQSDRQIDPQGVAVLHANGVAMRDGVLTTQALSVFRLDGRDRLLERRGELTRERVCCRCSARALAFLRAQCVDDVAPVRRAPERRKLLCDAQRWAVTLRDDTRAR